MQACCSSLAAPAVHRRPAAAAFTPVALPRRLNMRPLKAVAAAAVPAAELPSASDLPSQIAQMAAVRKALRSKGWDDAWIDTVVGEVRKGKLRTTVPQLEETITYLESECKIPTKSVENMAAVAPDMLASSTQQIKSVVDYARRQGIDGPALVSLLEDHPKLLTYTVSSDGKLLEKGKARASIDLAERQGRKLAGVSYWREGAAFETSPVAPYRPKVL